MTENDYIAEYVKEKCPQILGVDYKLWVFAKVCDGCLSKLADKLDKLTRTTIEATEEDDDADSN